MRTDTVVVIGMGEVGQPLCKILSSRYHCLPVDVKPVDPSGSCSVLHICYPFQIPDFVGTSVGYIEKYKPALTVINSTVAPGTTKRVSRAAQANVAYSPVRGKHAKMEQELLRYAKFVGADQPEVTNEAVAHFSAAGFKTATFRSSEIGELAKLIETTWLGILVGFAQEAERCANAYGGKYEDVNAFIREIDFLPYDVFPGFIGGHCVMPNIAILKSQFQSDFLNAVESSNTRKACEFEALAGKAGER